MKSRIAAAAIGAILMVVFTAHSQEKKENEADKKALQGSWTAKKDDKTVRFTIDGDKFTLDLGGKSPSGTYVIDSSKKPKHIDLTIQSGSDDEVKKYEGKTSKGLYELDGDRLKWLAPEPGLDERPAAFPADGEKTKTLSSSLERETK